MPTGVVTNPKGFPSLPLDSHPVAEREVRVFHTVYAAVFFNGATLAQQLNHFDGPMMLSFRFDVDQIGAKRHKAFSL
jgi:hypothetical protein